MNLHAIHPGRFGSAHDWRLQYPKIQRFKDRPRIATLPATVPTIDDHLIAPLT
jgi:hypothetical protein